MHQMRGCGDRHNALHRLAEAPSQKVRTLVRPHLSFLVVFCAQADVFTPFNRILTLLRLGLAKVRPKLHVVPSHSCNVPTLSSAVNGHPIGSPSFDHLCVIFAHVGGCKGGVGSCQFPNH